jgi:hypothetical protein
LKSIIRTLLIFAASVVVFASVLVHPNGGVKAVRSANPLLTGSDIDPIALGILERSCQNCHSEKTEWPWYSHIAPMSWLVEKDVSQAREHMNLSHWDDYSVGEKQALLARIGAMIRSRQMPPDRYTMIHPEAKISDAERERIYEWSHTERRRLNR